MDTNKEPPVKSLLYKNSCTGKLIILSGSRIAVCCTTFSYAWETHSNVGAMYSGTAQVSEMLGFDKSNNGQKGLNSALVLSRK